MNRDGLNSVECNNCHAVGADLALLPHNDLLPALAAALWNHRPKAVEDTDGFLSCPFCGSIDTSSCDDTDQGSVYCHGCGSGGPTKRKPLPPTNLALKAWNTRH